MGRLMRHRVLKRKEHEARRTILYSCKRVERRYAKLLVLSWGQAQAPDMIDPDRLSTQFFNVTDEDRDEGFFLCMEIVTEVFQYKKIFAWQRCLQKQDNLFLFKYFRSHERGLRDFTGYCS